MAENGIRSQMKIGPAVYLFFLVGVALFTFLLIQQGVRVGIQPGLCGSASRTNKITIPFFRPLAMGSNVAVYEGLTAEKATADAVLRTLRRIPGTCGSYSLRVDAVNVNLAAVRRNPVAVTVTLPDGSSGCLSINNALIDQ